MRAHTKPRSTLRLDAYATKALPSKLQASLKLQASFDFLARRFLNLAPLIMATSQAQAERRSDLVRMAHASTYRGWPKRNRGTECGILQAESCRVLHCRKFPYWFRHPPHYAAAVQCSQLSDSASYANGDERRPTTCLPATRQVFPCNRRFKFRPHHASFYISSISRQVLHPS